MRRLNSGITEELGFISRFVVLAVCVIMGGAWGVEGIGDEGITGQILKLHCDGI